LDAISFRRSRPAPIDDERAVADRVNRAWLFTRKTQVRDNALQHDDVVFPDDVDDLALDVGQTLLDQGRLDDPTRGGRKPEPGKFIRVDAGARPDPDHRVQHVHGGNRNHALLGFAQRRERVIPRARGDREDRREIHHMVHEIVITLFFLPSWVVTKTTGPGSSKVNALLHFNCRMRAPPGLPLSTQPPFVKNPSLDVDPRVRHGTLEMPVGAHLDRRPAHHGAAPGFPPRSRPPPRDAAPARAAVRDLVGRDVAVAADDNYRKPRTLGVTIRKTMDVIIGTFASATTTNCSTTIAISPRSKRTLNCAFCVDSPAPRLVMHRSRTLTRVRFAQISSKLRADSDSIPVHHRPCVTTRP